MIVQGNTKKRRKERNKKSQTCSPANCSNCLTNSSTISSPLKSPPGGPATDSKPLTVSRVCCTSFSTASETWDSFLKTAFCLPFFLLCRPDNPWPSPCTGGGGVNAQTGDGPSPPPPPSLLLLSQQNYAPFKTITTNRTL